jgi:hypothetical protein
MFAPAARGQSRGWRCRVLRSAGPEKCVRIQARAGTALMAATFAFDDGGEFDAVWLAKELGVSEKTARNQISILVKAKALKKSRRSGVWRPLASHVTLHSHPEGEGCKDRCRVLRLGGTGRPVDVIVADGRLGEREYDAPLEGLLEDERPEPPPPATLESLYEDHRRKKQVGFEGLGGKARRKLRKADKKLRSMGVVSPYFLKLYIDDVAEATHRSTGFPWAPLMRLCSDGYMATFIGKIEAAGATLRWNYRDAERILRTSGHNECLDESPDAQILIGSLIEGAIDKSHGKVCMFGDPRHTAAAELLCERLGQIRREWR